MNDRAEPTRVETELLARLGLAPSATTEQVTSAHAELVEFLEAAPAGLRSWARRQILLADDAYALLADSTLEHADASSPSPVAPAVAAAPPEEQEEVDFDELAGIHPATEGSRRQPPQRVARAAAPPAKRAAPTAVRRGSGWKRLAIGAGAVVGAVVIGIVVFNMNGGTGIPPIDGTPEPDASAAATLDMARVGELMEQISTNPRDTAAYLELAGLYWDIGDYASSADFMDKILDYDPDNTDALVGRGAARYQDGDFAGAEADWRAAIAIDENNQEAYFDLGFMYLERDPPDIDGVTEMWTRVVAIDPTTDMANYAQLHLDSFASPAASDASQGPDASPLSSAPSQSPAATPAPSS
jgi:tetratricopeptide (TPR) repeat protein